MLASGDANGLVTSNSICDWPSLDASGRFVAFLSSAVDLVTNRLAGDYHIYVRDMQTGSTSLVDADLNGIGSVLGPESAPSLSADGRFVGFHCPDANLVPNDRNHDSDVFVRDLTTAIELISAHDAALPSLTPPNGNSALTSSSISADGRFIAFTSEADNLVSNDTNHCRDVFLRDLAYGTNLLLSVDSAETRANCARLSSAGKAVAAD